MFFSVCSNIFAFSDVSYVDDRYNAISYLSSPYFNIFDASQDKFRIDSTLTRAEFLTVMIRFYNFGSWDLNIDQSKIDEILTDKCTDTKTTEWYSKYMAFAIYKGMIGGYPDKTCKPNNQINTAEAAKIIYSTFDFKRGIDITQFEGSQWYDEYINSFNEYGIVGTDEILNPDDAITRGNFALMISQAIQAFGLDESSINAATKTTNWENLEDRTWLDYADKYGVVNPYPLKIDSEDTDSYYMTLANKYSDGTNNYVVINKYNSTKRYLYFKNADASKDLFTIYSSYYEQFKGIQDTDEINMWKTNGQPLFMPNHNFEYNKENGTMYSLMLTGDNWEDMQFTNDHNPCYSKGDIFSYNLSQNEFTDVMTITPYMDSYVELCGVNVWGLNGNKLIIEEDIGDELATHHTYYVDLNARELVLVSNGRILETNIFDNENLAIIMESETTLVRLINLVDFSTMEKFEVFNDADFTKTYDNGCKYLENLSWYDQNITFTLTCSKDIDNSNTQQFAVDFSYNHGFKELKITQEKELND